MGDLTGEVIAGKYELLRLIGRGGMGAVYEARTITTLKRCAVKVLLRPELTGDEEVVRRFFREARASGVIESEHIVAAYDSGVDDAGRAYYVMEVLQGEDLQQLITRLGAVPPVTAAKIILQAANGLACAHSCGVVHRDVKPANLFLATAPEGEIKVKILDFGVAKVKMEVFHESLHSLTRTGSMLGTPLYMSPDQVKRASAIDESTDVWSLGVVLFELITGKLPWGNVESFGELIAAVLTQDLPLLQDHAPWVSPDLAAIVHRCLSRDPSARFQRAAELSGALRGYLVGNVRLLEHELTSLTELERNTKAERLSLADTMIMPGGRHSGMPLVRSLRPRQKKQGYLLAATAGAFAVVGGSAWAISRRAQVEAVPRVPVPVVAAPSPKPEAQVQSASGAGPSKPELGFPLEVGPAGVHVSVDGVSSVVRDGRVEIEGSIGSEHVVELVLGKQRTRQSVVISDHGIIPSKVTSPTADVTRRPDPQARRPNTPVTEKSENIDVDPGDGLSPDFK